MGKSKEPPPDPPPPPAKQVVQIHCVPWRVMDFQLEVQLPYLTVEELETIIKDRHGDPIDNLVIYADDTAKENMLPPGSSNSLPSAKLFYDYYPPLDPFANRPTAGEVYSTNSLMKTTCEEEWEGELQAPIAKGEPQTWSPASRWKNTTQVSIIGGVRKWSKTAEHDPHTQRMLDAEAARLKAEAEAKAAAEAAEAKRIADERAAVIAEKKRKEAEKAAAKKAKEEEEAREAAEAEAARLKALEEAAANDPVLQEKLAREKAEREAAEKKAAAEAALAKLPKRKPGGALPIFLGGTTKEYYGLDKCTKEEVKRRSASAEAQAPKRKRRSASAAPPKRGRAEERRGKRASRSHARHLPSSADARRHLPA